MIHKRVYAKPPSKKLLRDGEMVLVKLKPALLSPQDRGGTFIYCRVGDEIVRFPAEFVKWGE